MTTSATTSNMFCVPVKTTHNRSPQFSRATSCAPVIPASATAAFNASASDVGDAGSVGAVAQPMTSSDASTA